MFRIIMPFFKRWLLFLFPFQNDEGWSMSDSSTLLNFGMRRVHSTLQKRSWELTWKDSKWWEAWRRSFFSSFCTVTESASVFNKTVLQLCPSWVQIGWCGGAAGRPAGGGPSTHNGHALFRAKGSFRQDPANLGRRRENRERPSEGEFSQSLSSLSTLHLTYLQTRLWGKGVHFVKGN